MSAEIGDLRAKAVPEGRLIMKFLHIEEAKYLNDHRVWVKFSDGTEGQVDLRNELDGPIFEPLKGPDRGPELLCSTVRSRLR